MESFNLSPKDFSEINEEYSSDMNYFSYVIENYAKFSVGDILIKRNVRYYNSTIDSSIETYADSPVAVRYIVVHIHSESKMPFLREFDSTGKLMDSLFPLFDFASSRWGSFDKYELDPELVDSTIFGETYDLSDVFEKEKQRKKFLVSKRKEASIVFSSLKELNLYLKNHFATGRGELYFHKSTKSNYEQEIPHSIVTKISCSKSLSNFKSTRIGKSLIFSLNKNLQLDDHSILYLKGFNGSSFNSIHLLGCAIYKDKPVSYKDLL